MKQLLMNAINYIDNYAHTILIATPSDPKSPYYGISRSAVGLSNPGCEGLHYIGLLATAYTFPQSKYYKSNTVLKTLSALCHGVDKLLHVSA